MEGLRVNGKKWEDFFRIDIEGNSNAGVFFGDNATATFGTDADYRILFDGTNLNIDEGTTTFFALNRTSATWTTDATTEDALTLNLNTLTSGNGLIITADSDILTTGKIIDFLSGSSSTSSVFSLSDTEILFNNGNQNIDFRIKSVNNNNMFFLDANANSIQIGKGVKQDGYNIITGSETQTTDATQTTLQTIGLQDENTYYIKARVNAVKSDGSDRATYEVVGTFYRTGGGGATIQGSVTSIHTSESDATWGGVTLTASGNNVLLRVTGKAGTTIDWGGWVTYTNSGN